MLTSLCCGCSDFYPRSPCGERPMTLSMDAILIIFLSTLSLRRATTLRQLQSALCRNFYPRSPCGERQRRHKITSFHKLFLSTLSLRRATNADCNCRSVRPISIHALLAESDVVYALKLADTMLFLSTLSLRRATYDTSSLMQCQAKFLSTLSLRRATPPGLLHSLGGVISIHALLAESDLAYPDMIICTNVISIHALLAESDSSGNSCTQALPEFLSTLSLRRAT